MYEFTIAIEVSRLDRFLCMLEDISLISMITLCRMSLKRSSLYGLLPMWYLVLSAMILEVPDVVSEFLSQWSS